MVLGFLLSVREDLKWEVKIDDEDLFQLIKDRIISRDYIRQKFILLVPFYIYDEGEKITLEATYRTIDERIDEYRSLFKGVRVGNMGNKRNCIDMMNKFMIDHPNVSFDTIVGATIYYVENTDYNYIMGAENFIYKTDDNGRLVSKLETVVEEYVLSGENTNLL